MTGFLLRGTMGLLKGPEGKTISPTLACEVCEDFADFLLRLRSHQGRICQVQHLLSLSGSCSDLNKNGPVSSSGSMRDPSGCGLVRVGMAWLREVCHWFQKAKPGLSWCLLIQM